MPVKATRVAGCVSLDGRLRPGSSWTSPESEGYLEGLAPPAETAYLMGNADFISEEVATSVGEDVGT